jgi:hypothetical protein
MGTDSGADESRLEELRHTGEAVGKLAEDSERFREVVEAFRAEDVDAFHKGLADAGLDAYCHLVCSWLCSKHCVFICIRLCGPIEKIEELAIDEIRAFAEITAGISRDEALLRRLVDAVDRQDVEAWRALIVELKLERFCHQLCHWLCTVRCRRVCRLLCPDPPLITEVAFIPSSQINPQGFGSGPSVPPGTTPPDNKPAGVGDHPFGGIAHIDGEYFSIAGVIQYKVEYAANVGGPWTPILAPVNDLRWVTVPTPHLVSYSRVPDAAGWYNVADIGLLGPTRLTDWSTPAPDGLYYLKLTVRNAALAERSSPLVPALVDNTSPTGPAPGGRPQITIKQGNHTLDCCETVKREGGPLSINVIATDANFSSLSVDLEGGCGASFGIYSKTYNGNLADTGAPVPGIDITWDPWAAGVSPCCYVMYVRISDRAIVNNAWFGGHSNSNWHAITIA